MTKINMCRYGTILPPVCLLPVQGGSGLCSALLDAVLKQKSFKI